MRVGFFILLFVLLEICSFILMADLVGAWRTILLVVLSMGAGFIIFRMMGEQFGMAQIQAMRSGQVMPQVNLDKAYLWLVAILLIIPGFFSDVLALLLLVPSVRAWCANVFKARMAGFNRRPQNDDHVTIDGECTEANQGQLPGDKE